MNNDPPFNPLPLPANLNLDAQPESAGPQGQTGAGTNANQENTQARKTTRRRRSAKAGTNNDQSRWERIKNKLTAKLVMIDQERLKRVLVGCGIAAGVTLAIVLAVKLMPLAVTILALLGVAMALEVWNRLRCFRQPPF